MVVGPASASVPPPLVSIAAPGNRNDGHACASERGAAFEGQRAGYEMHPGGKASSSIAFRCDAVVRAGGGGGVSDRALILVCKDLSLKDRKWPGGWGSLRTTW